MTAICSPIVFAARVTDCKLGIERPGSIRSTVSRQRLPACRTAYGQLGSRTHYRIWTPYSHCTGSSANVAEIFEPYQLSQPSDYIASSYSCL